MAVASVRGSDPVVPSKVGHDTRGNGFLSDVQMDEPGDSLGKEQFFHPGFETSNPDHGAEKLLLALWG